MHRACDAALMMAKEIWTRSSLDKANADQERAVLFLPSVGRHARTIHVSQKTRTHAGRVAVLLWQAHEGRRVLLVDDGVEVCSRNIDETHLSALRRRGVVIRLVVADLGHGQADHGAECFERRCWGEVRVATRVLRSHLAGDQT